MASKILIRIGFRNNPKLQLLVAEEVTDLIATLHGVRKNSPTPDLVLWCPKRKLNHFATGIMWKFLFGRRIPKDDLTIKNFLSSIDDANRKFKIQGLPMLGGNLIAAKLIGPYLRARAWCRGSNYFYAAVKVRT